MEKESLSEDIYLRFIEKETLFISKEISKFGIGSGQIMFLMQLYEKRWYQSRGTS